VVLGIFVLERLVLWVFSFWKGWCSWVFGKLGAPGYFRFGKLGAPHLWVVLLAQEKVGAFNSVRDYAFNLGWQLVCVRFGGFFGG